MDRLEDVAREAGRVLLRYKGRLSRVEKKSSISDLVSEADYESQRVVFEGLDGFGAKLVGEENYSGESIREGEVFLVDPLDGTLNYVHGLPYYSVSIARLIDGKIVEGVVYIPESDEMFHALSGEGAFLNGERIEISKTEDLSSSLVVTGWPYDEIGTQKTYRLIEKVNESVQEIRILGSCAAELAYLACGRIDGYFEMGLGPWDMAAGYVIALEAGAVISSMSGEDFDLSSGEIIASVPPIHEQLVELVKEALG